ncbi:DNA-methyltransferase [Amorphus orientalis]|uniref:Methyltransferase n=1 Tax=Amorphus orientalis TaxID=649198 RepID=A0AAE4AV08_9HYPH|nr:site-specific DNA-methyltransferase [Amorphus orientalis]MDQ0317742.1 site-specific DNA-methyltransferase (adenine-specific) [Amorphus orientalis]
MIELHRGDSRKVIEQLAKDCIQVHAVVTDPPYHLLSVVRRFGKQSSKKAKVGRDGRFSRQSDRFVGKSWDSGESGSLIAQDAQFWALLAEIILPGGYVAAFSSARTGHLQAAAMEQAGFVMHPFICWVYGTGMTKAKCAVRALGANEQANNWGGWYYGTASRKVAVEPIYIAQKPFSEKNARENILKHGVGPVNIEGCRPASGRWPANFIHDGSREALALLPEGAGEFFESYANPFPDPVIYHRKANKEDRSGSTHPTVKPVALIRSLIRHVTPPGGIVLDPFAGSGTTGEAARQEGVDCILIEQEDEYVDGMMSRLNLRDGADVYLELLGRK